VISPVTSGLTLDLPKPPIALKKPGMTDKNQRYTVDMQNQELQMKPVANGTSFTSKFAKNAANDNSKKSFTPIPTGFFSVKHGRSIQEELPKVAFGKTTDSPDILCKVEQKYEFGGIKKKAGRKNAEIHAKQKTYIPIVLDYLECKIKKRLQDDVQNNRNNSID